MFPSLLSTWAKKYDDYDEGSRGRPDASAAGGGQRRGGYFGASLAGYAVGCVGTELASVALDGGGVPALLFIAPSMAAAVLGTAYRNGELDAAFEYGAGGPSLLAEFGLDEDEHGGER